MAPLIVDSPVTQGSPVPEGSNMRSALSSGHELSQMTFSGAKDLDQKSLLLELLS